jgi:hypothetical protein
MVSFFSDPQVLSALAAAVGPLAFFAAPTEEIERLLSGDQHEAIAQPARSEPIVSDVPGRPDITPEAA